MIEGWVDDGLEAVVRLVIRGSMGQEREIEAVVDTGFNGFLTLPVELVRDLGLAHYGFSSVFLADGSNVTLDVYVAYLEWNGRRRYVTADATGTRPLVGMQMLHRHSLYAEVVKDGRVVIDTQG